jgi:hypothetical protein
MIRKEFKSRLFKKTIKIEDLEYWSYLYAESLYRIRQLNDLKCFCGFCFGEKVRIEHLIQQMEEENHIPTNPKANKISGRGDCGRRLGPVA